MDRIKEILFPFAYERKGRHTKQETFIFSEAEPSWHRPLLPSYYTPVVKGRREGIALVSCALVWFGGMVWAGLGLFGCCCCCSGKKEGGIGEKFYNRCLQKMLWLWRWTNTNRCIERGRQCFFDGATSASQETERQKNTKVIKTGNFDEQRDNITAFFGGAGCSVCQGSSEKSRADK